MKTAIYPGSFNPWHKGHEDILRKALKVFDKVIILQMQNPEKPVRNQRWIDLREQDDGKVEHYFYDNTVLQGVFDFKACAVIRGLRNGNDLQYEMNQQYWNEDVGVYVPFVYFITDRKLSHVSSSAIRTLEKLDLDHPYVREEKVSSSWVDNCDWSSAHTVGHPMVEE